MFDLPLFLNETQACLDTVDFSSQKLPSCSSGTARCLCVHPVPVVYVPEHDECNCFQSCWPNLSSLYNTMKIPITSQTNETYLELSIKQFSAKVIYFHYNQLVGH